MTICSVTGANKEVLDLDNSVFMNFKRYTKQDVVNCFEADMRSSNFEMLLPDETQLNDCAAVFEENYAHYCQLFHEISAQFNHFPLIDLKDLSEILYTIGIYAREKAKPLSESVITAYRQLISENDKGAGCEEELFNRVKFAEILLLVIIKDNEGKEGTDLSRELRIMFKTHIVPFLTDKHPD